MHYSQRLFWGSLDEESHHHEKKDKPGRANIRPFRCCRRGVVVRSSTGAVYRASRLRSPIHQHHSTPDIDTARATSSMLAAPSTSSPRPTSLAVTAKRPASPRTTSPLVLPTRGIFVRDGVEFGLAAHRLYARLRRQARRRMQPRRPVLQLSCQVLLLLLHLTQLFQQLRHRRASTGVLVDVTPPAARRLLQGGA